MTDQELIEKLTEARDILHDTDLGEEGDEATALVVEVLAVLTSRPSRDERPS